MICVKNLRFSSHPRGKVRRQGPPGSTRAQPWRTKGYGVTNQRPPLCLEAYTRHTGNYIICNFIYSFTYLFNHFQQKTRLEFKCVLADNLPSPWEVGHTTGVYVPYSFQTVVWVLLLPTKNQIGESAVRQVNYGFSSLSEKTRESNCLQKSLQRQHFLLSYFNDPDCWSSQVFNSQPPTQQTDTLSTEPTRQCSNDNKLQDKLTAQDPQVFAIPILSSQF